MSWKDNKGSGPWDFTEQPNKWGYLNNPRWSSQQECVNFCQGLNLPIGSPNEHAPCGHWHKTKILPLVGGKWVAAMQQPGTPYVYLYDIAAKAVIRVYVSDGGLFVDNTVRLNSTYAFDYDMGYGNPGTQRGAYCMNKDGTRIWYLFCDQGQYPLSRDHPNAELVEVDITSYYMRKVKSTIFPNLLPAEPFPGPNAGRVNDGCSDNIYTYWCTDLIAGRIIKIRNSDHSIVDDHTFNYPIEACGGGNFDEAIASIDFDVSARKLYWVYVRDHSGCIPSYSACRHFIRSDTNLNQEIDEIICGTGGHNPSWQNMVRIYSGILLHHRAYHPSVGSLSIRKLDLSRDNIVAGTVSYQYNCFNTHIAEPSNRPTSGANHISFWGVHDEQPGGDAWILGRTYYGFTSRQDYLQNILGIKGWIFTLMHVNSIDHPAYLYCFDPSNMNNFSTLDVSYYAGQAYLPDTYDWDWTSVSAMNWQTGRILIFRYDNVQRRNYAVCFKAAPEFDFVCDTRFDRIYDDPSVGPFGEPQVWSMPE